MLLFLACIPPWSARLPSRSSYLLPPAPPTSDLPLRLPPTIRSSYPEGRCLRLGHGEAERVYASWNGCVFHAGMRARSRGCCLLQFVLLCNSKSLCLLEWVRAPKKDTRHTVNCHTHRAVNCPTQSTAAHRELPHTEQSTAANECPVVQCGALPGVFRRAFGNNL